MCALSSGTYSCSPAIAASTNNTSTFATSDSADGTYNVYGVDSENAGFCCPTTAASVTNLVITGGAGTDTVLESNGTESLCGIGGAQGLTVTVYGVDGEDAIAGSPAVGCTTLWETFYGGAGGDTIQGEGRTVTIYGEANGAWGDWLIDAGDASDSDTLSATLSGGAGVDLIESYNDLGTVMLGGDGGDIMFGGDGPDEMHGGADNDEMSGGPGADSMWGDGGGDIVAGDSGTDSLYGGGGDDTICGGADNGDSMWGGNDNDVLDDDGFLGVSYGEGGTDTCDLATTTAAYPSCDTLSWTSYQCGSY